MPKKTLDIDDLLKPLDHPNLIPGIYNYCNRRCERCPFTERCLLFLDLQGDEALQSRDALDRARDSLHQTSALMEAWCEREGIDFAEIQRDAHSQEVAEELRKIGQARADPLQRAAETYAHAAWKVVEAVNRAAPLTRWPVEVDDAIDTIAARRQLLLPVGDNYFCRRRVSKGVSPTTWRLSVVVVGRSVAVLDVSAGAPAGA